MERNEYLETISDKIRGGEPVSFIDALMAIDYQESLKTDRASLKWWQRALNWIRSERNG